MFDYNYHILLLLIYTRYDCFRIWESLLAGSMPVIERSTGLDRTLYKLPALQVDDFADLTPG